MEANDRENAPMSERVIAAVRENLGLVLGDNQFDSFFVDQQDGEYTEVWGSVHKQFRLPIIGSMAALNSVRWFFKEFSLELKSFSLSDWAGVGAGIWILGVLIFGAVTDSRAIKRSSLRTENAEKAKGLTALKLAATEQATQAEAVLKERTRERDEFERKGKELCVAYGTALITIHDLTRERDALALSQGRLLGMLKDWRMNLYPRDHAKYCRASVKYPDWPDPKDDRCDLCKRTDAAIAEATPEGDTRQ